MCGWHALLCIVTHTPHVMHSFVRVNKVCKEHRVPIHVHLHETAAECADSVSGEVMLCFPTPSHTLTTTHHLYQELHPCHVTRVTSAAARSRYSALA